MRMVQCFPKEGKEEERAGEEIEKEVEKMRGGKGNVNQLLYHGGLERQQEWVGGPRDMLEVWAYRAQIA
eukprot:12416359-Karenia_brevis.AAC.1